MVMPSENLRWETLLALKCSPKGRVTFDPHWSERGEHILAHYVDTLCLSPQSGKILERLSATPPQDSSLSSASKSGSSSPGLSQGIPASLNPDGAIPDLPNNPPITPFLQMHEQATSDELKLVGDSSGSTISLLSPKAMEITGCILRFEEEHREKAKAAVRKRQQMQEELVVSLANAQSEQLKRFEELTELKQRQEHQTMTDLMDRETQEIIGRQEKLKEEHRHRIKRMNLRLREMEQQRLREEELERQRQAEDMERRRNLNAIQEEILQLNQQMDPSTQFTAELQAASLSSYTTRGNQLCSQVSEVLRKTAEGEFVSVEDMMVARQALDNMRTLIQQMRDEAANAQEEKKKQMQEEEQRKQVALRNQKESEKKAAQLSKERAQRKGLQSSAEESTLKWYRELQTSAAQCAQSFEPLNSPSDNKTKKLKLELQKAATIPVSQISSNSGSQLREIFEKLDKLLSGRALGSGVSTSQHPQALEFVSSKLAEKFVKQGEEEVAAHFDAAFPIAAVACGVWERHPHVGDLILAHLHRKCPYAIPHYPPMKDSMSVKDYQKILGFRVDESGVESQDSFIKRMSGMVRLYAAIVQLRWPFGAKQEAVAPHGLNHGWRWLAQILNMEPVADITATLIFDFLEVCGNALMKQYQNQFWKLILLLKEEYFPRIEAVTNTGQMGSVIRLKQFLETTLQSRNISPPKGYLSSAFWRQ